MTNGKSTAITTATRADTTVCRLRNDILTGVAEPGDLLAEAAVARQLGVSRVPVREALFSLEREGLVEFSTTGRAYVKSLTAQDFEELLVLRLTLEPLAARLAAPQLARDADSLAANIEATSRAHSLQEVTRLDLDFHELILAASGHARLLRLWRSLRSELELWLGRLHRQHQTQTKTTRAQTVKEHDKLLTCFRQQSAVVCERQLRLHIQGWREWLPIAGENAPI